MKESESKEERNRTDLFEEVGIPGNHRQRVVAVDAEDGIGIEPGRVRRRGRRRAKVSIDHMH